MFFFVLWQVEPRAEPLPPKSVPPARLGRWWWWWEGGWSGFSCKGRYLLAKMEVHDFSVVSWVK